MSDQSPVGRLRTWWNTKRAGHGVITKLSDPEQTKNRAEVVTKACQALIVLNGGAALALLAFLGKVWPIGENDKADVLLIVAITDTMFWLVIGLVLAFVALAVRYKTSLEGQFHGTGWLFKAYQKIHDLSLWGSIAVFVYAMIRLVFRVQEALPAELGNF